MYTSHSSGFLLEQSANFPGNVVLSSTFFLLTLSLAFLAASLALAASIDFLNISVAIFGFSSKKAPNDLFTRVVTAPLTSLLPSFVLVCPQIEALLL